MRRLFYIAYFFEVGLLLLFMPWSSAWDHNYFADSFSQLIRPIVRSNFVRGAVSGVGLINLWAGFADLRRLVALRRSERDKQ